MSNYFIYPEYVSRADAQDWDDTSISEEMMATYQKEVYELALGVANDKECGRILDVGCGSGLKLVKYFPEPPFKTIGTETTNTFDYLQRTYPTREWVNSSILGAPPKADLVICADVIEHLQDPDLLLNYIKGTEAKWIIISTPNRDKTESLTGPPSNVWHIREWSRREFTMYIASYFDVMSNVTLNESRTQAIICRP